MLGPLPRVSTEHLLSLTAATRVAHSHARIPLTLSLSFHLRNATFWIILHKMRPRATEKMGWIVIYMVFQELRLNAKTLLARNIQEFSRFSSPSVSVLRIISIGIEAIFRLIVSLTALIFS